MAAALPRQCSATDVVHLEHVRAVRTLVVVARLGGRVLPRQSAAERSQTEERYVRVPLSFASYPLWPPPCSTRADRELVSPTELRAYLADWHSDSYAALWGLYLWRLDVCRTAGASVTVERYR